MLASIKLRMSARHNLHKRRLGCCHSPGRQRKRCFWKCARYRRIVTVYGLAQAEALRPPAKSDHWLGELHPKGLLKRLIQNMNHILPGASLLLKQLKEAVAASRFARLCSG